MTWHGHLLIIFGFLPQNLKTMAVAVSVSVQQMNRAGEHACPVRLDDLDAFRGAFYDCLSLRADALFELTDEVLCAEGPVSTLVGLSLTAEHRRGHGALYDGLGSGRIEVGRLRRSLVSLPVPRDEQGRITLAVDVSPWLRPDAATSPDRSFCRITWMLNPSSNDVDLTRCADTLCTGSDTPGMGRVVSARDPEIVGVALHTAAVV